MSEPDWFTKYQGLKSDMNWVIGYAQAMAAWPENEDVRKMGEGILCRIARHES